jgi:peptidoglycan hydrolase-like protein with peptidoglycan-binding domain
VVLAAGATLAAALGVFGGGPGVAPVASNLPPATAEITLETLVATAEFDGTLGYGDTRTVSVPATGAGIITWRAPLGGTVERGGRVYEVNAVPVVLMYGSTPFFRTLGESDSGADVEQLEDNLRALGYEGITVDEEYTWATAAAVAQWQEDLGMAGSGRFDPVHVVVAGGPIRVARHEADLGATAGGPVLSYTGTRQMVVVALDVADRHLVVADMAAGVRLPDGSRVDATVAEVGTVAVAGEESDVPGGQEGETTIEVTLGVDDPDTLAGWDIAPVEVVIEIDRREDVLTVPVGALVALAEGGYGVQLVEGGGTRYVAVETGLFADGRVEVSGTGIEPGQRVGVPA